MDDNAAPEFIAIPDPLVGMYFWWDDAPRAKKRFYHGHVAAALDGGYYLLRFAASDDLPSGLHEIVHVATMTEEAWSFYRTEAEYAAAVERVSDAA